MKKLLAKITFPRFMIAACLVGSGVLGVLIWFNYQKITGQSAALATGGSVAETVRQIQAASKRYTNLYQAKGDENLRAQDNPQEYISAAATHDHVQIGRVDIRFAPRTLTPTTTDHVYTVLPHRGTRDAPTFTRNRIANFFWKLEFDSRRVRITELSLTAVDQQGRPWRNFEAYPLDLWSFSCKLTSRQRVEEAP